MARPKHNGSRTLTSQVHVQDDPHLHSDAQFGVTRTLVGDHRRHDAAHPTQPDVALPWYSLDDSFTLEPGVARLPQPPIT